MELADLVELVQLVDLAEVGLIDVDGPLWRPPAVLAIIELWTA